MPKRPHSSRGTTLIEVLAAMAIVMFGAAGVIATQRTSVALMGDARRTTRATAYAQDLLSQMQLWDFTDTRLADKVTENDADTGDSEGAFMTSADPIDDELADFAEGDLGAANTLDTGYLDDNGMQRFWNVTDLGDENGNGMVDGKLIAVIVRWPHQSGWRRIVLMTSRKNPADY
jgi:Tfp pilus assembly protein PilV